MPELPEVQTIVNNLNTYIQGDTLLELNFRRTDVIGSGKGLSVDYKEFIGEKLLEVSRHGKYLLFYFTNDLLLIVHLRMTGKLIYLPALNPEDQKAILNHKHSHVRLDFSSGPLIYNDVRRFGRLYFTKINEDTNLNEVLNSGPDALSAEFTPEYLYKEAQRHPKQAIKTFLLNQKNVAGVGNIYADESLFKAKILPYRPAKSLSKAEIAELHQALIETLKLAIKSGGTSFSDYRNANNAKGSFQDRLYIYGRAGENCLVCNTKLEHKKLAGRTTVYCPHCQK